MNNILYFHKKRGDLKQSQPKLMASPPALVWGAVLTLGLELPRAPVNTSSLLVEPDLYPPPLLPPVCLEGREGALFPPPEIINLVLSLVNPRQRRKEKGTFPS